MKKRPPKRGNSMQSLFLSYDAQHRTGDHRRADARAGPLGGLHTKQAPIHFRADDGDGAGRLGRAARARRARPRGVGPRAYHSRTGRPPHGGALGDGDRPAAAARLLSRTRSHDGHGAGARYGADVGRKWPARVGTAWPFLLGGPARRRRRHPDRSGAQWHYRDRGGGAPSHSHAHPAPHLGGVRRE